MSLSADQKHQFKQNWNEKKPLVLSMTFVGAIQLNESPQSLKNKIYQTQFRYNQPCKKEESFEPQENQETQKTKTQTETEKNLGDSDFVFVTYRALSATLLADRPVDFSNQKMLKQSVNKLKGQTVFKDHETSVNNWVGRVESADWDEKSKDLPAGINARLKLDTIKDPMTVRGVLQGAIHSASVTVSFEWQPSHPKLMKENTFFDSLGEEIDGSLVRIVVTEIQKFWEISLVWQGADEFAKQIDKENQPAKQSALQENLTNNQLNFNPSPHEKIAMDKLNALMNEVFNTQVTEANFKEVLQTHTQSIVDEFQAKADQQITKLEANLSELKTHALLGAQYLNDERNETIRLYKLAKENTVSEAILKTLEKAELETIQAFKKEFEQEVENKFPAKCKRCGSHEITRQSSLDQPSSDSNPTKKTMLNKETANRVKDLHAL